MEERHSREKTNAELTQQALTRDEVSAAVAEGIDRTATIDGADTYSISEASRKLITRDPTRFPYEAERVETPNGQDGVKLLELSESGFLFQLGLRRGDTIVGINQTPLSPSLDAEGVQARLLGPEFSRGAILTVTLRRSGKRRTLTWIPAESR